MKVKKIHHFSSLLILLISITACAQWGGKSIKGNENVIEETRNLSGYSEIEISGNFDVELVEGVAGKISIVAESNLLEHILTEVNKEKLSIGTAKRKNLRPNQKIKILIPFENLELIEISGSGNVSSKKTIVASSFALRISGSAKVDLMLDVTKTTKVFKSGSGDLVFQGQSDKLDIKSTGSGNFDGEALATTEVDIQLSGSGNLRVNAEKSLKVKLSGSGNVYYKGEPSKVNTNVSGSGKIERL